MLLVLGVAALGSAVVVLVGFRPGCIVVGAAVLVAGLLRVALPERQTGMLVIRSKPLDLLTMGALGAALVVAAVVVPAHLVNPSAGVGTVVITPTPAP
ncbi:MAG: DUF3017 domain-containing protein [Actinomycetes bacterium]